MFDNLKALREPTLQSTYLKLSKFIETENKGKKTSLRNIVDERKHNDWDAFDQSIRMIIIDRAQLHDELSRCLFENEKTVIRRAVKCKWFFQAAPIAFFIEELLPIVSASTRLKVISALGRFRSDEEDALQIFKWVRNRFGLRTAEPLLPRCPEDFISAIVLSEIRPVHHRTFGAIIRRLPNLGLKMTEHWLALNRDIPVAVGKFLSNNPKMLADWGDEKVVKLNFNIGRKLFRSWQPRLVKMKSTCRPQLLGEVEKRLFRSMSHENRVNYLTDFLRLEKARIKLSDWERVCDFKEFLMPLRSELRDSLLHEAFQTLYKKDLWSSPEACFPALLEITSSTRRAELLNNLKLNDEKYWYLQPPSECIPKYIKKVKATSVATERSAIVLLMIASCRVAWDSRQLEKVLEFVINNRPEDLVVIKALLKNIKKNTAFLRTLSTVSYRILADLTNRLVLRGVSYDGMLFAHEIYLARCIDEGQNVEAAVSVWISDFESIYEDSLLTYPKAPQSSAILGILYKCLPRLLEAIHDSYNRTSLFLSFINAGEEVGIDFCDMDDGGAVIINFLDGYEETRDFSSLWKMKVGKSYSGPNLWKLIARLPCLTGFMQRKPQLLLENITELMTDIVGWPYHQKRFLRSRRLFAFYNIDKKIAAFCEDKFKESENSTKEGILFVYSFVASIDKYQELASDYLTCPNIVDTAREDSKIFLDATLHLRNLNPAKDLFSLVKDNLVGGGDKLYSALPAFQKACYNVPVSLALPELVPLLQAPVSVFKKAVGILANILPRDECIMQFRQLWKTAKHYSARTVLLRHLLVFFLDDPSSNTWMAVEECIAQSDEPLLLFLPDACQIPDAFIQDYASTIWYMLAGLSPGPDVTNARIKLLRGLSQRVSFLTDNLCRELISPSLFLPGSITNTLALRYLSCGVASLSEKLNFIESIFRERVDLHPKAIVSFVKAMLNEKNAALWVFLPAFLQRFREDFKREELFEARWLLTYLDLIQKVSKGVVGDISYYQVGQEIQQFWVTEPHRHFLHPLMTKSLINCFPSTPQRLSVLFGLIEHDVLQDPAACIALLEAIPHGECTIEELDDYEEFPVENKDPSAMRRQILRRVRKSSDPSVQLYFNRFIALEKNSV